MNNEILTPDGKLLDLTPPGWTGEYLIANSTHELLIYPDEVRFKHRCDRGKRGTIWCAPSLHPTGHTVSIFSGQVTVSPSILCPDCGIHGFISSSVWADV